MEFELTDIEQPYIDSRDASVAKEPVLFSGAKSPPRIQYTTIHLGIWSRVVPVTIDEHTFAKEGV